MTAMPFDRFRAFIEHHDDFLIVAHVDPDGDAVGSCLGLQGALLARGKRATVVSEDAVPENLRFLPGTDGILLPSRAPGPYRAVFVLDCSSLDRVGPRTAALVAPDATIACIDHHAGNEGFGDPRFVVVAAAATAELVYDLVEALGVPITPEIAAALYTGIASDTGAFRYLNTTPRVLRIAARLVERGADAAATAEALYARKSASSLRILGLALASLEARASGTVAALTITREMFDRARATPEDADGIVQYAKSLLGSRVGVLLQETAPGEVRISFRSDGSVDVNQVAARFGGGGHKVAAGARVSGPIADVRETILRSLEEAVNGGQPAPRG
ncbi:MAG: DHH family phosphoesterase [Hyphomicrobiales bacterium]